MFGYLVAGIALAGTAAASYYDLKTTNVPDFIAIYMAIAGILAHSVRSIITGNFLYIEQSLLVGIIFTAVGGAKYVLRLWGGADFLLLGSLGVVLPYLPKAFEPLRAAPLWPFPATLIFNLLVLGALYSIGYSFFLVIRQHDTLSLVMDNVRQYRTGFTYISATYFVASAGALFAFSLPVEATMPLIATGYGYVLGLFAIFVFLMTVQKHIMERTIATDRLEEGDILAEDVELSDRILEANRIAGVTHEMVEQIRAEKDTVAVMEGVPYIPAFVLTVLVSLLFGDVLTWAFTAL